ncbi:MAG: hypothetical protein WD205_04295, partial [Rhodothermales bacterium]
MKVLHGTMEVANQMHTLATALKRRGIDAHTLNYYPSYLEYEADAVFDIRRAGNRDAVRRATAEIALTTISYYDVFHFHYGSALTPSYDEMRLLRSAEKPVFMHHWGSDARLISAAKRINPFAVSKQPEAEVRRQLEFYSRDISRCIVGDHELKLYVDEYYDDVHVVPTAIDLDRYAPLNDLPVKNRPLVVHAPTSPQIKGTSHVLKAVETLQDEIDFDFVLVQNRSHQEAMAIYQQADIVVDQLLIGSHGLFAAECMAMGKPVICWITEYMQERYPASLPIVSANPDTLREKLQALLLDAEL